MQKLIRIVPTVFIFCLALAVGIALAAPASGSPSANTKTTTVAKKKPASSKTAASTAKKASHTLASAEDLTGTIASVDPANKEITLMGSNGVPYDFMLSRKTQIELSNNNKKISVNQLASESKASATVHFVPESNGNLAEDIQIKTS